MTDPRPMQVRPVRVGIVGAAWRGQYFVKLVSRLSERMECAGVVARRETVRREVADRWNVPVFETTEQLLHAASPDFVVTSVSWDANPAVIEQLVAQGVPVLAETPPAPDLGRLRDLWSTVGESGLVQVAEQYALMPTHAARLAAARTGIIGEISSVQISSTHLYHAASLIRRYLNVGFEEATISASRFSGPLVNPSDRSGWTRDSTPHPATTTIATFEFASGRSALYDFTENQSRNHLRSRRLLLRGSHGEIDGDRLVRIVDDETILKSRIRRHQTGYELDHEGFESAHLSLDGEVLWRNPFIGERFNDEDIAMSATLVAMADWVSSAGPPPYPLAEAAQDHLLGLAIEQSADEQRMVTAGCEAWAAT